MAEDHRAGLRRIDRFFSNFWRDVHSQKKPTEPLKPEWYTPKTARVEVLKNKPQVGNCFICHMQYVPDPAVVRPAFAHGVIQLR